MRLWVLTLLSFLSVLGVQAQEIHPLFSGRVSAEAGTPPGSLNAVANLGFDAQWEGLSGQVLGGVGLREGRNDWDLPQAWLAYTAEFGQLKGGIWPESRGPAQFRSLVPAFTAGSGTEFLATAGTAPAPSPAKAALRIVAGEWSWSAEVSPWRPAPAVPDTASPWFPRKDLPQTLDAVGRTLRAVKTGPGLPAEGADWPFRTELRWSALWGDLKAGAFHGSDPQVLFPARLVLDNFDQVFDVVVQPRQAPSTIGWFSAEVPVAGADFWTEQRLTKDRLKIAPGYWIRSGEQFTLDQNTAPTDVWEGLWGASYSLSAGSWGMVRVWTEGSVYRDLGAPDQKAPDFTAGWVGGVSWEDSRGRGRLDLLGGTPWDPVQGWLWARATWNWMEGRALWLGAPVFWGARDTAWGQFADRKVWALGTAWDQ